MMAHWQAQAMQRWQAYSAQFAALTQREKIIVTFAVVFGIAYLGFNFGLEPQLNKGRIAAKAIQQATNDKAAMQPQLELLKSRNADPDTSNRERLEQINRQLVESGERIAKFQTTMVPPERMQAFLESVLRQNRNLELMALKTLPALPVGALPATRKADLSADGDAGATHKTTPAAPAGIYQHGIEITLAGSYNDLLGYLNDLEKTPQRVMWNSVSLSANYPRSVMTLRVYTLSLDKHWLTV